MRKLCLFLAACLAISGLAAQQLVPPSSTSIKSIGRIDKSNPERYRFDFPGTTFAMKFKGSANVAAKYKASAGTYFEAFINGEPIIAQDGKQAIYTSVGDTAIVIASNLDKSKEYTVTFFKRTENNDNIPAEFMGFEIDNNAVALDAKPLYKARKMEFIGNSITCAFGSEAKNKFSPFSPVTENNYLSYAQMLGRAFDADVQIAAHSGRGVVRNYGDKNKVSTQESPMPVLFEQTIDSQSDSKWNFEYRPDIVVINLGTNDYSTRPHPDKEVFTSAYLKLISRVRAEYGKEIPIVCVVGPMIDEPCFSVVKEVVEKRIAATDDQNIAFLGIPQKALDYSKDFGACWHPGGDGAKKMAQIASPLISTLTGWNYSRSEIDDIKGSQDFYSREK